MKATLPTADLIRKYFDEVVTSSGIDPKKRPDVALQWAQEKELWAQEADAEIQQQLLQVLKVNQNVKTQQLHHQQELILRDLQQARLIELRKREEYLATLAKPVKLPKVNKKMLNSDVETKHSFPKSFFKKDNKIGPYYEEDNYGTILMREIGQALANEYEIYHPVQIEKPIKQVVAMKKPKKYCLIYKKGPKSRW
ncbi:hypothetical protein D6D54_05740 [Spiroplasma poulsonii]|uniref:Uncharacterized protein n=1 Tax=Spiroplasma poulsonii TaxID=2138 RepID=A0A433EQ29_9MOLU|nr:hypothetical protein [Spiroplasma poulsonii]MBW3058767.1 hypothetical protein [Spiroplasma poulsonii]RUP76538.1 hypothetical protein D6D54_05740 [Spiroplasma poulsonii]